MINKNRIQTLSEVNLRHIKILADASQMKEETILSGITDGRINQFPLRYVDALIAMQKLEDELNTNK